MPWRSTRVVATCLLLACGRGPAGPPEPTPGEPVPEVPEQPADPVVDPGGLPPTGQPEQPEQPPPPPPPPAPPPAPTGPGTGLARDPAARFELPPLQTRLEDYELVIPDAALRAFAADLYAPEQPATFRAGGRSYAVQVSLRGASSRTFPKKSWNVDFGPGVRFDGRRRLNLVAEFQDATLMVEKLAYDLLAALGVRAPRGRFVRLALNGRPQGVYLDLEQVDKPFLEAHGFTDVDATIWRCGWKDCEFMTRAAKRALGLRRADGGYQLDWELKTNERESRATLDAALDRALEVVNHAPDAALPDALAERLALEPYLRALAVDALVSNSYVEDSESYFVHDRAEDRWFYVPWDLNNADARFWHEYPLDDVPKTTHPMVGFTIFDARVGAIYALRQQYAYPNHLPVFSNLATRVTLHPALRERLLALVERALEEVFTPATIGARIDAMYALVSPAMHAPVEPVPVAGAPADFIDPRRVDLAKFERGPSYLETFVARRIPFLRSQIARIRGWRPTLALEAIDVHEGWVELANRGGAPVSLGGKTLTPWLRRAMLSNLPARTLAPGERLRVRAADVGITLGEKGEVGLFDGLSVTGLLDAAYYGPVPAGKRLVRGGDGVWQLR